MKKFNTTALCIPSKHYMVDITNRVKEIRKLVDEGKYFSINRARQYGKTTTLNALTSSLSDDYIVLSLDFQDISEAVIKTEGFFVQGLSRLLCDAAEFSDVPIPDSFIKEFKKFNEQSEQSVKMDELFRVFTRWFKDSEKPVVLIIDEVDSATNNQVFLDFLAQLRSFYLKKEKNPKLKSFHSVILAGVTDVKHLKIKIRGNDAEKENSPWNIASDFSIDMSLSESGIQGMLDDYESDHHTGMDTKSIAKSIYDYTSGYPYLVSRICQLIDENISLKLGLKESWSSFGIDEAVKLILSESNTLFDSINKNLNNYPAIKSSIRSILMEGCTLAWNPDQKEITVLQMYGLIKNDHNKVKISNRIFETRLYNMFLSDEELKNNEFSNESNLARNLFVKDGKLDIRLILEHFIVTYTQVCGPLVDRFREKDGRELFLLYLKPIINGTGNYYIEAQTRDQSRTDVIIDYLGQQYIIELKIWRGERYNTDGEKQICEYLNYWNLNTGYMLSFNFNKKKETGVKKVELGDKILFEGML